MIDCVDMIQVFILTHNRPHFLSRAVASVLSQTNVEFELVISDNSSNDLTRDLILKDYSGSVEYRRRIPELQPIDHLNVVLSEVESDYFMMFHDDDVMHKNLVGILHREMKDKPKLMAVGANAIRWNNSHRIGLSMARHRRDVLLTSPDEIASTYMKRYANVPFPSYMYRIAVAEKVRFNFAHGGKYADVAFMMDISMLGNILMKAEPLMDYHVHSGQDSQSSNFLDKLSLMSHIQKMTQIKRTDKLMKRYRVENIYEEMNLRFPSHAARLGLRRKVKLLWIFMNFSPLVLFPRIVYKMITHSLKVRGWV
jgi:glycosyltransferase involved in cell wall biosynthesis